LTVAVTVEVGPVGPEVATVGLASLLVGPVTVFVAATALSVEATSPVSLLGGPASLSVTASLVAGLGGLSVVAERVNVGSTEPVM